MTDFDAINELSAALAGALSPEAVARAIADGAAPVVGADFSNLAIYDRPSNRVRVTHGPLLHPAVAQEWAQFPLDEDTPLGTAIISGLPVLLGSIDEIGDRYPRLRDDTIRAGYAATASLPLLGIDARSLGAVGFAWYEPQTFSDPRVSTLQLVAQYAAYSLERLLG